MRNIIIKIFPMILMSVLLTGSWSIGQAQSNTFPTSGNVGVGTTDPNKKLHVRQSQGSVQLRLERITNNSGLTDIGSDESGLWFWVGGYDGFTNTEVVFRRDGNVGIGIRSPSSKLTVNGTTETKEVIVEESVGADFVFEEDYLLPELAEVESFIQSNKHLPDIPSADEMKRNGVKVGALQMKLLQKIEELTLHTIEQQKQIEILKQEVEKLKNSK